MREFEKIYLSWRKGRGNHRHIVGLLQKAANGYTFAYRQEGVQEAKADGFTPYTEFPDLTHTYNGNVLDVFAQRLTKPERPDIQEFYTFWEIEPKFQHDKFYLLGHTQGLMPTDNFEFLADYEPVKGLHFLTELAGLTNYQLSPGSLHTGDILRFEIDRENKYDREAVKIFKGIQEIGYVKKIHCRIFHKLGAERLKLTVKAVDKNGVLKKVFIKVSL